MIDLAVKVAESEPSYFFHWIEHEPEYRLVVSFMEPDGDEIMRKYLEGVGWADSVATQQSDISLDDLLEILKTANDAAIETEIPFESGLHIPTGKVHLFTSLPDELRSQLESKDLTKKYMDRIVVVKSDSLSVPADFDYPYLPGGMAITNCTAGYAVERDSDGRRFMSTAGHCGNNGRKVRYGGSSIVFLGPVIDEYNFEGLPLGQGKWDFQVHDTSVRSFDLTNVVRLSSISVEEVVSSTGAGYTYGASVCKIGKNTGYTCGDVTHLYYSPTYEDATKNTYSYVRVDNTFYQNSQYDIACGGDSGGPVFDWVTGGISALGIISGATTKYCNGGNWYWIHAPVNQMNSKGYSILTDHYPQQYYLHVYVSNGACTEYVTPIKDNGDPDWNQQTTQSCTSAPGSGTLQSYNGFVVGQNWREGLWRDSNPDVGWARAVPLFASGAINWSGANWSQCCSGTAPAAQDGYIVGNHYYLNVFESNGDCVEYITPLKNNGDPDWNNQTQQSCRTSAPGSGTVQSYNAYVVGEDLREGMWRNSQGYIRTVPLNSTNTDVDWNSAPSWSTCCSGGTVPAAQGGEITTHQ